MGHCDRQFLSQFHYRSHHRLQFHGTPRFQILQHGGLVFAHFFGSGNSLVDGDGQLDSKLVGHRLNFGHDTPNNGTNVGVAGHAYQGGASESADRIKRHIAQQLHPYFLPITRCGGNAQPGTDQLGGDDLETL